MPAVCTHILAILATKSAGQATHGTSPRVVRVSLQVSGALWLTAGIPHPDSLTGDLGIWSHGLLVQCLDSFLSRHAAPQRHRPVLAWKDLYLPLLVEIVP